ncbi:hypothetical protein COX05_03435, partial [candidate division WWE3 bacterium CG22_combo_CG10-13_8_21_14_all_39_12]
MSSVKTIVSGMPVTVNRTDSWIWTVVADASKLIPVIMIGVFVAVGVTVGGSVAVTVGLLVGVGEFVGVAVEATVGVIVAVLVAVGLFVG